ncbi:MAG: LysM peptidoglycan-binding domain-containing protein [Flavobacteriales bacterium]
MKFLSFFLLSMWSFAGFAQNPFFSKQENIFTKSSDQWLVKEFTTIDDAAFIDKNTLDKIIESKKISKKYFLSKGWDDDKIRNFENLIFPNNENKRCIQLASLCHLYFPLVEKKLSTKQLPREFKYLPLLVSGYNQHASVNPDRAGMWALDYLTARKRGLQVDSLVDERRGGDLVTDAAVRELAELYQFFQGEKDIVLKAWYISRAFAQTQRTTTQNSPLEQQAEIFVSFFEYTQHLFDQFVYTIPNKLTTYFEILGQFEPIAVKDTALVEGFIKLSNWNYDGFINVNPVFIGKYIDPTYRRTTLLIDNGVYGKFISQENNIYAYQPKPSAPASNAGEFTLVEEKIFHTVRRGETLGTIARKHKVTISQLKKWNKLRSDKIRQGQRLVIVKSTKRRTPKPDVAPENPNIDPTAVPDAVDTTQVIENIKPDSVKKPEAPVPTIENKPKQAAEKFTYYKVKSGDSLWSIAKKYKVTPEEIMKWNKIGQKIRPGQKLKIKTK